EGKVLRGGGGSVVSRHRVEGLIADVTPVDIRRLLLVAAVDVGEALGIGGLDDVEKVIRPGRLEQAARAHCLLFTVLPKKSNTTDTPRRSSSMARDSIRLRHFAEAFAKSASDWISKPSRQIHASSQNTTPGTVPPSS